MSSSGPETQPDYSTWSTGSLIARISELERQLHSRTTQYNAPATGHPPVVSHPSTETKPQPRPTDAADDVVSKGTKRKGDDPPADDITRTKQSTRATKGRDIDPSKYHTRFIALKFAYLGQRYNGLEHANGNVTPLPTVEEVLWKALRKTRLIFPPNPAASDFLEKAGKRSMEPFTIDWEGCEYSKAGRTDRGVSAFGQVIALRVRSSRPKFHKRPKGQESEAAAAESLENNPPDKDWDDVSDELPYVTLLNAVLPEDIRILAWCPHPPPNFNARFSCRERHYKYFFTQPAFTPTPGATGLDKNRQSKPGWPNTEYREGWLDIDAMREAAKHFEGKCDFRNFCTLDHSKQISIFDRMIYRADIELVDPKAHPLGYVGQPGFQPREDCSAPMDVDSSEIACPSTPQVYAFILQGNAFLWHQVRHMMGILFLVGQGLESPSVVPELLDTAKNPGKPGYEMASDAPLVLWDCVYPDLNSESREESLDWIYVGDPRMVKANTNTSRRHSQFGSGGIVDDLWAVWRQRKMDETLAGALLDLVISKGDQRAVQDGKLKDSEIERSNKQRRIYQGGDKPKITSHVPVMQQTRTESVEVRNAKWLAGKQHKGKLKRGKSKESLHQEI
ncbi:hypothetical protein PHISP_07445 [Aspergillus sp. HF37]|nr:hypothetical protein PHISP_07445 [Aspergillus sp. HF37]